MIKLSKHRFIAHSVELTTRLKEIKIQIINPMKLNVKMKVIKKNGNRVLPLK